MRVTVSGLSGLTKAYTSVLSATGSFEISGASRCDDIVVSSSVAGGARQASYEVGVVVRDFLGADHDRDVAGGGVSDVHDQRAGGLGPDGRGTGRAGRERGGGGATRAGGGGGDRNPDHGGAGGSGGCAQERAARQIGHKEPPVFDRSAWGAD